VKSLALKSWQGNEINGVIINENQNKLKTLEAKKNRLKITLTKFIWCPINFFEIKRDIVVTTIGDT